MSGLHVWIDGHPRPKGSLKPVWPKGGGRVRLIEDNEKSGPWRDLVVTLLKPKVAAHPDHFPLRGGVRVAVEFVFEAPKKAQLGERPDTTYTGDVDKLARNIGDALQDARVVGNDSQIVEWSARSWYGIRQGVWLSVTTELSDVPFSLSRIVGVPADGRGPVTSS